MTPDGLVDIHCHILPGIDDGARDLDESAAMARLYVAAGFAAVVATPHFIPGTAWSADSRIIAARLAAGQARLDAEGIPLRVYAGMEIAFHKRLADRLQAGSVLPLGLSAHFLIEPTSTARRKTCTRCAARSTRATAIIAHVERITAFQRNYDPLLRLARQGLEIQVNSGSLLDHFDQRCRKTALELLANGCVHYLASDHGARRRTPPSPEERQRLADLINPETLVRLWRTNPARLLDPSPESIHHPPVDNGL